MDIKDLIAQSVLDDYYTAAAKCEVTMDTLITPVIEELLFMGGYDLKYITKEFPIFYHNPSNMSRKTDYLMYGHQVDAEENNVYLVELKTSTDSIDKAQRDTYAALYNTVFFRRFPEQFNAKELCFSARFLDVLNEKVKGKYKLKVRLDGKGFKEALDDILNGISEQKLLDRENVNDFIKEQKLSDTQKYIKQAVQIRNFCDENEKDWYKKKIRIIYLVPEKPTKKQDEIEYVTFQELVKEEKWKNAKNAYINWLFESILCPIFGEGKMKQ